MNTRILIVDDDKSMLDILERHLIARGFSVSSCTSADVALQRLKQDDISLVITDLRMTGLNGIELCDRISGNFPDLPVLILTAFGTLDVAVQAIRAGAYDFIVKPVNLDALTTTIERCIRNYAGKRQVKRLRAASPAAVPVGDEAMLGECRAITELRALLGHVCNIDTSILITGESGTGKELTARVLHQGGKRRSEPFVTVNCAGLTEGNFESVLFGEFGSSDSDEHSSGLVGSAGAGTLFFDEILHLPLSLQPKILRLLEERTYRPIGSREEIPCMARFVVATNEDVEIAVKEGDLREDLFFRINVMHLKVPPLRERGNDVVILAHHFLQFFATRFSKQVKSLSDPVVEKLACYEWPGNVRELRNTMERAVAVTRYDHIVVEDLPDTIQRFKVAEIFKPRQEEQLISIDAVEERHILGVLKELKGNKALTAKVLGMDRKTLYRKLDRYGYKPEG